MYTPTHFSPKEQSQISELIKNYPFVTMISKDESGNLSISHIPVVSEIVNNEIKSIKGHFSLRNPQVKHLQADNKVTLIFNVPHTYITPTWYKSGQDVPTWNYCVVHIHGKIEFNNSFDDIYTNLKELTKAFEYGPKAWRFELPADLEDPKHLTAAIIAFTIIPEKIEAKFKLSQNRPLIDRNGVIEGLDSRQDDMSGEIKKLMKMLV